MKHIKWLMACAIVLSMAGRAQAQTAPIPMSAYTGSGCSGTTTPGVTGENAFFAWSGGTPGQVAMDFSALDNWDDIINSVYAIAKCWSAAGYQNVNIAVPLVPNGTKLWSGTAGQFNSYYDQIGAAAVRGGFPNAIFRIDREPNLSALDASDPADHNTLFQIMVKRLRLTPGSHFLIDWCISVGAGSPTGAGGRRSPDQLFPGAAYVDIYGFDFYDFWGVGSTDAARWAYWMTPYGSTPIEYGPAWLVGFALKQTANPSVAVDEWGEVPLQYGSYGDDAPPIGTPGFMAEMAGFINDPANHVIYHGLWDVAGGNYGSNLDQPGTLLPLSAAQFKQVFPPVVLPNTVK